MTDHPPQPPQRDIPPPPPPPYTPPQTSPRGHVQPHHRPERGKRGSKPEVPRRRPVTGKPPRYRGNSGLYLPAWSVLLMLATVVIVAAGVVALVIGLGGNPASDASPRVIIITAEPSPTLGVSSGIQSAPLNVPTSALVPPANPQSGIPTFALEGPTLPPVILSPTPRSITVGSTVVVDADGLNIRRTAGLDGELVFIAENGTVFIVIGGPTQASGITWWQVRDPNDPARSGWAAADYLVIQDG